MKKLFISLFLGLSLIGCGGSQLSQAQGTLGIVSVGLTSAEHQADSVVCSDTNCETNKSKAKDAIDIARNAVATTIASLQEAASGDIMLLWTKLMPCVAQLVSSVLTALNDCGITVPSFLQDAVTLIKSFLGPCQEVQLLHR